MGKEPSLSWGEMSRKGLTGRGEGTVCQGKMNLDEARGNIPTLSQRKVTYIETG